jgi:hypothetical protein
MVHVCSRLSIITLSVTSLSITTNVIMILSIMTLSITTFCITLFYFYNKRHVFIEMPSVVKPSVFNL